MKNIWKHRFLKSFFDIEGHSNAESFILTFNNVKISTMVFSTGRISENERKGGDHRILFSRIQGALGKKDCDKNV